MVESQQTLRDRIAARLLAKDAESWGYGTFECSREFVLALADEMLAVRDDEVDSLRKRVAELELTAKVNGGLYRSAESDVTAAEAALARVRAIPRLPHTSERDGELGRAYTRGWCSVIAAVDASLDQPAAGETR